MYNRKTESDKFDQFEHSIVIFNIKLYDRWIIVNMFVV